VAASGFFGKETEVILCATFKEVIKIAEHKNESDGGIMAIEKLYSREAYCLIIIYCQKSNLKLSGEVLSSNTSEFYW